MNTTLAIEIVKMEGASKSWNQKFYQSGNEISIYINNEKIDVTDKIEKDSKGFFKSSPIVDEYMKIRKEANFAGMDAMMAGQKKDDGIMNYINNL